MNEIPTIYRSTIMAIVRHALTATSGMLISRGFITADQSGQMVELGVGLSMLLITIGWSIYHKYKSKQVLNVALANDPSTEQEAAAQVSQGVGVPSVLTSPTVVPKPL
jgi:hypothetical protein